VIDLGAPVTQLNTPVLWICGPAGVGKSTVSWQLFTELAHDRIPAAFGDADQFCMCYPAPPGDPGRERIKAMNVGAMIPNYRAAGARCVLINGVLDPAFGLYQALLPVADLMTCRLRANVDEVLRRYAEWHGPSDDLAACLEQSRAEVSMMDASDFADVCIETTGVPQHDVAGLVRTGCAQWPGFSGNLAGPDELAATLAPVGSVGAGVDGHVLLICGSTGVGKSTIGFQFYLQCLRAGLTAGYIDLDQIGFGPADASGAERHRLKARNLAVMWRNYRAAGATHLVATGPVESSEALSAYAEELPAAAFTVCRLRAGQDELRRRVLSRAAGGSWPQPGDPLRGQSAEILLKVAARAAEVAAELDGISLGDVAIDTDEHPPAEAADLISHAVGWPSRHR
jgi:adenylylsulfate kinase-like enzyme